MGWHYFWSFSNTIWSQGLECTAKEEWDDQGDRAPSKLNAFPEYLISLESLHVYIYIFIHIIWPSGWGQQCPEQESQWRWALSLLKQTRYMQNFSRIFRSVINEIDWSVPRPVHCICKDHEDKCLGLDTSCLAARKLRLSTSRILGILMGSCVSWSLFSSLVHLVDILYLFHFSFTKICCFLEVLLCKVLRGIHQVLPPLPGTMHSHRCYI